MSNEQMLLVAVSTLASVVAVLWRNSVVHAKANQEKLDKIMSEIYDQWIMYRNGHDPDVK